MKARGIVAMWRNRRDRENVYSTAAYWDAKATDYAEEAVSMWPNHHLDRHYNAEVLAAIGRYLPDVRGASVLDVGCGTGQLSRHLAARGAQVTGIDFSPRSLEIARRQTTGANPSYHQRSIFEIAECAAYDVAVTRSCLAMACRGRSELDDVLRRIRRALKPGGRLLLIEPVHRGFLHRVLDMDPAEFREAVSIAGFRVERTAGIHFWPMRLALAYVGWPAFVTAPCYHLGQALMGCLGGRLGDYTAVYATVPAAPEE